MRQLENISSQEHCLLLYHLQRCHTITPLSTITKKLSIRRKFFKENVCLTMCQETNVNVRDYKFLFAMYIEELNPKFSSRGKYAKNIAP